VNRACGLIPVLEAFDLHAPYQQFNPVFQGQLSGDDFTHLSTRQEPRAVFGIFKFTVNGRLLVDTLNGRIRASQCNSNWVSTLNSASPVAASWCGKLKGKTAAFAALLETHFSKNGDQPSRNFFRIHTVTAPQDAWIRNFAWK
jgi:hypothetical protein